MKLKLADNLSLPPDAVTQTFLIVGKRGSGKSNTAARLVEQFHRARLPFVVLDPVDTWWGLKAGRNGEKGLDVYVFGGRKQDLPLNAGDGALIANVLCEHRASMVLSVKHLSGRERSAFMVAFAQTLFQKWGGGPLHVVLEEAHELAPQMSGGRGGDSNIDNEAAMLGAFKRLWKLGRASGIGGSAITQRPASLSKDITTQSEILIAHRTIGPQDVDAIGQWVKYHGERLDILAELPSLPTGDAFLWAPEFPEGKPLGLLRTSILLRETYDSASTPKVGEQRVEPKELAPVDLERLRAKMSATIAKAKAEDPRELRKELAAVKAQLAAKNKTLDQVDEQTKRIESKLEKVKPVEKFVLKDGQLARFEQAVKAFATVVDRFTEQADAARTRAIDAMTDAHKAIALTRAPQPHIPAPAPRREPLTPSKAMGGSRPVAPPARPAREVPADGSMSKAEQRVLDAVAWWRAANILEPTRVQVAMVARYTVNGHFNNLVGGLRTKGLVDYPSSGGVALTDAGEAAADRPDGDLTRAELIQRTLSVLKTPALQRIFTAVVNAGRDLTRDELAAATNYTVNGHFNNMVGSLRSLGVIDYPSKGGVQLADMFEALA